MYNVEEMRKNVRALADKVVYDKAVLASAIESNKRLDETEDKLFRTKEYLTELLEYEKKLKTLYSICNKKAAEFTEGRRGLIEQTVEENLRFIFPEENFKVKLDLDLSKAGRKTCKLLLGKTTKDGIVYSPTTAQNGRFVRQLISVVVVYTLNYLRGTDMMYLDEALASSDKSNLTKLKPLLDRMVENGMQVVLIEHKPELYNTVTRRQFTLNKDRMKQIASIVSVEDIRGLELDECCD